MSENFGLELRKNTALNILETWREFKLEQILDNLKKRGISRADLQELERKISAEKVTDKYAFLVNLIKAGTKLGIAIVNALVP